MESVIVSSGSASTTPTMIPITAATNPTIIPITQIQIQGTGALPSVAAVSGLQTLGNVQSVQNIVVGATLPTISQVWYNCGPDGGVTQLVTANPSVVELNPADIARHLNQQVATPFGNIQVQVQEIPSQMINKPQQVIQLQGNVIVGKREETVPSPPPVLKSRVKHGGSDRVPCQICGKTVSCNATLRDHLRTHTGERPFACSECGLAFAQRSNLRMHKRLHTGEKPYMCGICGKTFARSSHLPAHMRTHTGEKPYVCKECDHGFITSQQLKNHIRVHTGEKPWKCDKCPAAFTHSSSLSTHKKKHGGSKMFTCNKCDKAFFFSSALEKHMKVHTKSRPYHCVLCSKNFKYKESLTVHLEKYCDISGNAHKKRAPRKTDAKKPGPKPGSGRKYVIKRKGKPRGRPRKGRGRWAKRPKIEGETDIDNEEINDGEAENDNHSTELKNQEEGEQEFIPTAELKVEVISPEEAALIEAKKSDVRTKCVEIGGENSLSNLIQVNGQEINLDDTTSVTIVSAEEAQQHMAAGGVQFLTLANGIPVQLLEHHGEDGQVTHQFVMKDEN